MTLEDIKQKLMNGGPDRVVINKEGEAVPYARAKRDYGLEPSIVFALDDGWTLGAPDGLHAVAEGMWSDEWVAVFIPGSWDPVPYNKWRHAHG